MTMIVQVFVLACACALGNTEDVPPYSEALVNLVDLFMTVGKNVISMEGSIPELNDPRRHYAEIVNVINYEGKQQSYCFRPDYDLEYQKSLNVSASEAISQPQLAIDNILALFRTITESTRPISKLIRGCAVGGSPAACDQEVHKNVKADPDTLGPPASILLTAGVVGSKLAALNEKFLEVSNKFAAHAYVIQAAPELKDIVFAVADLHRSLNGLQSC